MEVANLENRQEQVDDQSVASGDHGNVAEMIPKEEHEEDFIKSRDDDSNGVEQDDNGGEQEDDGVGQEEEQGVSATKGEVREITSEGTKVDVGAEIEKDNSGFQDTLTDFEEKEVGTESVGVKGIGKDNNDDYDSVLAKGYEKRATDGEEELGGAENAEELSGKNSSEEVLPSEEQEKTEEDEKNSSGEELCGAENAEELSGQNSSEEVLPSGEQEKTEENEKNSSGQELCGAENAEELSAQNSSEEVLPSEEQEKTQKNSSDEEFSGEVEKENGEQAGEEYRDEDVDKQDKIVSDPVDQDSEVRHTKQKAVVPETEEEDDSDKQQESAQRNTASTIEADDSSGEVFNESVGKQAGDYSSKPTAESDKGLADKLKEEEPVNTEDKSGTERDKRENSSAVTALMSKTKSGLNKFASFFVPDYQSFDMHSWASGLALGIALTCSAIVLSQKRLSR